MTPTQQPALIYCDLDGVLHHWPCTAEEMFDADCIARLGDAIRLYDVGIVITSTWRLEWPIALLKQKMGVLGEYVVGTTPEIDDPFLKFSRYHEVLQHQQRHAHSELRWVAIDDEMGRYPSNLDNLVLCDPRTGFSAQNAVKLSRLLRG